MSKRIEIKLIDPDIKDTRFYAANDLFYEDLHPMLQGYECKNILKEAKKTNITRDELLNALVAEMYYTNSHSIVIDIDKREKHYAPPKVMTLAEIEEALGYKIKLVGKTE